MVTYLKLKEKFFDKGYELEFHWFVLPCPPLDIQRVVTLGMTMADILEMYAAARQTVYGEEWDYWNTWIDYQRHKF